MKRKIPLLLLLSLLAVSAHAVTINLGTASTFGLLGGSGVTNTGLSVIRGDVGSSPTPSVIGFPPGVVIGTLYTTPNAVTAQAQSDLTTAYVAAAGAPCPPAHNLTGVDLGTFNVANPLTPGVYCFSSSAGLTGNLTLDGLGDPNSQWVFQIGSSLTTATNSTVSFINGASPCNVFWQVGSSATIQTNNDFGGTIMALASITLNGGTLNGRALARNGAVTIAAAEFVNTICPSGPCVTITKTADVPVASVGDVVTYTYTVCNCGPAVQTVNSVIDSDLGNLTADFIAANGGTPVLVAGACRSFTKPRTVLITDPSPLVNTVVVDVTSGGVHATDTAEESVIITTTGPCITIAKTPNRTTASVGDFITYTFDVCNCGTESLTVNSVIDSRLGDLTADFIAANGGSSTLGTGLCISFTEVYKVLATDVSPLMNTVTITAQSGATVVTDTVEATVSLVVTELSLRQAAPAILTGDCGTAFRGYLGPGAQMITAVPCVFAIRPQEPGDTPWANFIAAAQDDVPYTIKNITLTKTTPSFAQCTDVFPSHTVIQHGTSNIRLWWPLMYEAPGTVFTLSILYGTSTLYDDDGPGPHKPSWVHLEQWTWTVEADFGSLTDLVALFHELPFGLDEVPLLSDESLFTALEQKIVAASAAFEANDTALAAEWLSDFELEVMDACIDDSPLFPNPGGPGTGIANSAENPACCKLLIDVEYILRTMRIGMPSK